MIDPLSVRYPRLAVALPRLKLADLPTPVEHGLLGCGRGEHPVTIKHDDLSAKRYGGNKVRKLEYLLRRAADRGASRIATFGTVASNHALATALYAKQCGFECTCLLSHQARTPNAPRVLNMHIRNETELVAFGGDRHTRVTTARRYLQGRGAWVIPMGGSSWLGAVGFVNAALELIDQVAAGELDKPDRIYVANGTMATAAGLAIGFALANVDIEVHAVRVTHPSIANRRGFARMIGKTVTLLNRLDPTIDLGAAQRARVCWRDEFFAGGYARSDHRTEEAVAVAKRQLGLTLECTYTGKAMAALLDDLAAPAGTRDSVLFWHTYNSRPLPVGDARPESTSGLPEEFLRYFD